MMYVMAVILGVIVIFVIVIVCVVVQRSRRDQKTLNCIKQREDGYNRLQSGIEVYL